MDDLSRCDRATARTLSLLLAALLLWLLPSNLLAQPLTPADAPPPEQAPIEDGDEGPSYAPGPPAPAPVLGPLPLPEHTPPPVGPMSPAAEGSGACYATRACASHGLCGDTPYGCAALGDEQCEQSQVCATMGMCAAHGGSCVANSVVMCEQSKLCGLDGACHFDRSQRRCVMAPVVNSKGARSGGIVMTCVGGAALFAAILTTVFWTGNDDLAVPAVSLWVNGALLLGSGIPLIAWGRARSKVQQPFELKNKPGFAGLSGRAGRAEPAGGQVELMLGPMSGLRVSF